MTRAIETAAPGIDRQVDEPKPNNAGVVGELAATGAFLLDRLTDFENRISTDDDSREFHGHVAPAIANHRAALAMYATQQTEGYVRWESAAHASIVTPIEGEGRNWTCPADGTACPPDCDSDDRRQCATPHQSGKADQ